jgi:hypothetical protein
MIAIAVRKLSLNREKESVRQGRNFEFLWISTFRWQSAIADFANSLQWILDYSIFLLKFIQRIRRRIHLKIG